MSIAELLENIVKQIDKRIEEIKPAKDAEPEEFERDRIKRAYYGGYIDGLRRAEMELRMRGVRDCWRKEADCSKDYLDNR